MSSMTRSCSRRSTRIMANKCKGRNCPDKDSCFRFTSKEKEFQWWDNYDTYRGATCQWFLRARDAELRWYMYVVQCSDKTLYCGITTSLSRRVDEHNTCRGAKYVMPRRPVKLVANWEYPNRSTASKAEYAFKKLKRAKKQSYIKSPELWVHGEKAPKAGA